MKSVLSKELLASIILSLLVAACSDSGGKTADNSNVGQGGEGKPIDTQSCEYQATDGANVDLLALQDDNAVETSFGKKINEAWLKPVAKANIIEAVKFINNTEAQVYQTTRLNPKGCSRDLFGFASTLTSDLTEKWNSVKPKEGVLLGLYLPKNVNDSKMPSLNKKAAILLRVNTSKWTLVHEYMHHLFMLEAVSEGYDTELAFAELDDAVAEYKTLANDKVTPANELLVKRIDNYARISKAFDSNLVHFTLEEMTIEKKMKEMAAAKDLVYAPNSSSWYLQESGAKAKESIQDFEDWGQELLSLAKTSVDKTASNKVEAVLKNWSSRKNEISSIMTQFPKDYYNLGNIAFTSNGYEINNGCSHSHRTEELLKIARSFKH